VSKHPKKSKKSHGSFPAVIYVRKEQDGEFRYFMADKDPAVLMHGVGDSAKLARYTFADTVTASTEVKLGDE
jgi:hypothetical protein